jgi:hypothetical protein
MGRFDSTVDTWGYLLTWAQSARARHKTISRKGRGAVNAINSC